MPEASVRELPPRLRESRPLLKQFIVKALDDFAYSLTVAFCLSEHSGGFAVNSLAGASIVCVLVEPGNVCEKVLVAAT